MPQPSGLSVHYPFALVEFLSCTETDEHEETGEVLLAFLDESGCRVTLRVRKAVLQLTVERLAAPADKPEPD